MEIPPNSMVFLIITYLLWTQQLAWKEMGERGKKTLAFFPNLPYHGGKKKGEIP